jgi:hypothetical protein
MSREKQIHEGYLMIDHRASPGLTEEQARKLGYEPQHVSEGQLFEAKTNHCNHCGTVVVLNPLRTRERAYCQLCNKYICDNCGVTQRLPDYVHKTHKQHLDEGLTYFANLGNNI